MEGDVEGHDDAKSKSSSLCFSIALFCSQRVLTGSGAILVHKMLIFISLLTAALMTFIVVQSQLKQTCFGVQDLFKWTVLWPPSKKKQHQHYDET